VSFSGDAKAELCQLALERRCCAQAECYGAALYANRFDSKTLRIVTESEPFARRLPALFQKAFQVAFDRSPGAGEGKRVFSLTGAEKLAAVWDSFGYDPHSAVAHHINFAVLEEEHCRHAFFRGAFLAGGSVTNPAKGFHLEICTSHASVGREMLTLLRESGFEPRAARRGGNQIVYFKQSEIIATFLSTLGAPTAAETLRRTRKEKDLRGEVNRRVNCDAANLDKAVDAAVAQVEMIRRLQERVNLETLPPKLAEAARLRLAHPDMNLTELGALCKPPITKSTFHYRLKQLAALSA